MDNLLNYINNTRSAENNFWLAAEYENQKQYAGAISFYLRCAEYGEDKNLGFVYESLLRTAICFQNLGGREYVEKGWLLHAISLCPERPEGYWMLCLYHERKGEWQECYAMACTGSAFYFNAKKMLLESGYEPYVLQFQKAVAAWWIGRTTESRELFFDLPNHGLNEKYQLFVQNNLSSLGSGPDPFLPYDPKKKLKFEFKGYETIEQNYSQTYQDMFVLSMLDGKRAGFYLEIGSAHPTYGSNTMLLESGFGWKGISLEIKETDVQLFNKTRINKALCKDATSVNWDKFLKGMDAPTDIDYLQVDCEPPATTYQILASLPFETYRFAVITFEHDYYADASRKYRGLSRQFLIAQGYVLVVGNVAPDQKSSFEDWWVHPGLVSKPIIKAMESKNKGINNAEEYMIEP